MTSDPFQDSEEALSRHLATPEVSAASYLEARELAVAQQVAGRRKVYLDTCFWVMLRDAAMGRARKAEHVAMLNRLRELVAAGKMICPVSDVAFMELTSQTDDTTRQVTGTLCDELSLGVALASEQDRVRRELECFFANSRNPDALQTLRSRMWTRPCYVLGRAVVSSDFGEPRLNRALQKASIDALWPTTFTELSRESSSSLGISATFQRRAENINGTMRQHQHEIPSFERAFNAEVSGAVDVHKDALIAVILQAYWQSESADRAPSNEEIDKAFKDFRNALINLFRLRRKFMAQHLPTLYVLASCHAAVRMDIKRRFDGNFLRDIHHGAAGPGYHDAMMTEGPLRTLLMAGKIAAHDAFNCRIISDQAEALAYVDAVQ